MQNFHVSIAIVAIVNNSWETADEKIDGHIWIDTESFDIREYMYSMIRVSIMHSHDIRNTPYTSPKYKVQYA